MLEKEVWVPSRAWEALRQTSLLSSLFPSVEIIENCQSRSNDLLSAKSSPRDGGSTAPLPPKYILSCDHVAAINAAVCGEEGVVETNNL